jgi:pyruvate/2-oxoglutarate dehydrogenase complex dihydrolipoamide acyltransferase (E2) component
VDHPASLSGHSPWRTTALVASALAAFELFLLLLIVLALFARPFLADDSEPAKTPLAAAPAPAAAAKKDQKPSAAAPAKTASAAAPALARNETLVIVLNGNGSQGAASEKADLVRTKGYMIAGTANAPRTDFARSVVMFRPGHKAEAQRLASDFGVKRVSPLDGVTRTQLQGAHVALIVGAE